MNQNETPKNAAFEKPELELVVFSDDIVVTSNNTSPNCNKVECKLVCSPQCLVK